MSSLTTPPRAIFRQIQANLSDRYGSGFHVLKELIQNAEDAGAEVIRFIAHPGWSTATNALLRVPGFLVANDGRFEAKDGRGILSFADTAKGDEVTAIGRFGFGQKAVFHVCDAFIAHSLGHGIRFSEVVNPCLGVIESTKAGSWDKIDSDDLGLIEMAIGDIKRGLVLWLPLRCDAVLPAPKLFFRDFRPTGAALLDDLTRHEPDLRLILASMRHLDRIEAFNGSTLRLALWRRQGSQRLPGPPEEDSELILPGIRSVVGLIECQAGRSSRYAGREAYGVSERLKRLRQADGWPQVPVFTNEGEVMQKEKAAEHGAVVVVESRDAGSRGVSLDWGVFLPITEAAHLEADVPALRVMLHGYFFVDSGRRYIQGFASDLAVLGTGATGPIYERWNETLRDDLVLPLLPGVLYDALQQQMLTSTQLAEVTAVLRRSVFGREHRAAIAARDVLARRLKPAARGMATWELLSSELRLRPLPAPDARGHVEVDELLPELGAWAEREGLTLIAAPEAALTKAEVAWEPAEIADLLTGLAPEVFLQGGRTVVLAAFVDVAVAGDRYAARGSCRTIACCPAAGAHGRAGACLRGVNRQGSGASASRGRDRASLVRGRARGPTRPRIGDGRASVPTARVARRRSGASVAFTRRGGAAPRGVATFAAQRTDRRCRGRGRRGAGQAPRPRSERGSPRSRLRPATRASRRRRKRHGTPGDLARPRQRIAGRSAVPRQPARARDRGVDGEGNAEPQHSDPDRDHG